MKRQYEVTVIIRVLPNEEEFNEAVQQVVNWIEEDENGKVNSINHNIFGRRRLAYEIDKQREGYYVMYLAELDPEQLPELELNLKLAPQLLRYLIVRVEE
ncbi:30S ribosomal protein S6 [Anaerolineales bacterium]